jgi:hypothetical protein
MLEQVHQAALRQADAGHRSPPLYGFMRAFSLPSPRSISLTELPKSGGCVHPAPPPVEYVPQPAPSDSTMPLIALRDYHRKGAADFLDPERFGYVQDRRHVAGFEPHAFQEMPALRGPDAKDGDWTLEHLDLISLLKPTGPQAYVSANLPKLDELKTADTRLLHDFETRALAQLRTDDDVVIEEVEGSMRMVGALRAGTHCIQCHSVNRGELIGALSYEFLRKTPTLKIALK